MRQPGLRENYMDRAFPVEDEHLQKIRLQLGRDGLAGVQVGASDARILQFLVRLAGVKTMVELGTLYGYSTLCFARALPKDGKIVSIDVKPEHHNKARALLSATESWSKIELQLGDAEKVLAALSGEYDMVFIDANKGAYVKYLDWAEKHVKKGGLIVGDNTFLFGALFGQSPDPKPSERQLQVMREFNERLADSRRYNSAIIPTLEGITVAQKLF